MGNCMGYHSQPKKQTINPLTEGRELEVDASMSVEKIKYASNKRCIVVRRKLRHGEVYQLAQFRLKSDMPCTTTNNRKLKTRSVKILVTAGELESLLSGSKRFQIQRRRACVKRSFGLRGCQKWLPSLPTIQEVHNY